MYGPWGMLGMYGPRGMLGMLHLCVMLGYVTPVRHAGCWSAREACWVLISPWGMLGIYTTRVCRDIHHLGIYTLPHPGYTRLPSGVHASSAVMLGMLAGGNEALGSTLWLIWENRPPCASQALILLGLVYPSAQSYSGSPVRKTERLDSRRYKPLKSPMVGHFAQHSSLSWHSLIDVWNRE